MRRLFLASLAAWAALAFTTAGAADQRSETRPLPPFTTISNSGPISITIDVGKPQSVVASGNEKFLSLLKTDVISGELRLSLREHSVTGSLGDPKITITMPALTRFSMAGAGAAVITHAAGDSLDIEYSGAGSLKADGKVKTLNLQIAGVGSIDARELVAENVRVDVGGVGNVKVYASESLDADVGGVGSLKYYGNPRNVRKSAGGIGSISKGD
jgi:hypothetical protein